MKTKIYIGESENNEFYVYDNKGLFFMLTSTHKQAVEIYKKACYFHGIKPKKYIVKQNYNISKSLKAIDINIVKIEEQFDKNNIIDKSPIYTIMSAIKNIKDGLYNINII